MSRWFCPLAPENWRSFKLHIQSRSYFTKHVDCVHHKHEFFMLLLEIMVVHGCYHAKHIITLGGKVQIAIMLQQMVHIVTSTL